MKYYKKILNNDMNIILVPMKNTKIISIGFFIKAGSRNETDKNSGVAHFLEHIMFKGTTNRTAEKLFNELDILGAVYNAATTPQYTYYYVYGNSNDTKELLDVMLDIYINPQFNTKEINKERKVIIEEMRMRFDSPLTKLYSVIHQKIFADTSLARNIIGDTETIMNLRKKDMELFRSSLYNPKNSVFVVCGNFAPEPIYHIIKNILGPLKNSLITPVTYFNEREIILKNMHDQIKPYVYIKKDISYQQVYLIIAFPMYDLYSYKSVEIDILSQLLSSGFSSRLSKSLREKNGITYVSNAYPIVYSDSGLFLVQIIMNPSELIKSLKIVLKELKKIKLEPITDNEMEKIINVTKNETLYSLERPIDMLTYFGINFLVHREFEPDFQNFDELTKIKKDQIQETAKEIFISDKINLFMYGNIQETNYDFIDLCRLL